MTEKATDLSKRLVIGHKRDGRCVYDKDAKRELIEACLVPGVSIARMALRHGVNANLLRTWITRHRQRGGNEKARAAQMTLSAAGAFVPVVAAGFVGLKAAARIDARLPNGIKLDLGAGCAEDLSLLLRLLCDLPCSGSMHE